MPEPPIAFDLSGVNNTELTKYPTNPDDVAIPGDPGTVPAGAVVRITNLDRMSNTTAENATAQGSFEAVVGVSDGQELRFEWVKGEKRSAPADALFVRPDPTLSYRLTASPRFECLKVTPAFLVLDFPRDSTVELGLENGCDEAITLSNARTRLALPDFALKAALPPELASGERAEIPVSFQRGAVGLREDVLLLDVTLGTETIRYPITLRAP